MKSLDLNYLSASRSFGEAHKSEWLSSHPFSEPSTVSIKTQVQIFTPFLRSIRYL